MTLASSTRAGKKEVQIVGRSNGQIMADSNSSSSVDKTAAAAAAGKVLLAPEQSGQADNQLPEKRRE